MIELPKTLARSERSFKINGQDICCSTALEEFTLACGPDSPEASICTFSYEWPDAGSRPVLFAYNGGPGCASLVLHLAALGPLRIAMDDITDGKKELTCAPEENPDSPLDVCDIVLIDPIGTGYARAYSPAAEEKYYSATGDAESILSVMKRWLAAHGKQDAPVIILGESYGAVRNAMVLEKSTAMGVSVSGVIMVSSLLNKSESPFPVEKAVLDFSAMAAAHWLQLPGNKPELERFIEDSEEFAYREYLPALCLGSRLSGDELRAVQERLTYYIGLSEKSLGAGNIRLDPMQYALLYLKEHGRLVSIYDARFTAEPPEKPESYDFFGDDPCSKRILPVFESCYHSALKQRLGITDERDYLNVSEGVAEQFRYDSPKNYVLYLEDAMRRDPRLKLMFCSGRFDILTSAGYSRYLAANFELPADRTRLRTFPAGHMPYIGAEAAAEFGKELRSFIKWISEENQ